MGVVLRELGLSVAGTVVIIWWYRRGRLGLFRAISRVSEKCRQSEKKRLWDMPTSVVAADARQ